MLTTAPETDAARPDTDTEGGGRAGTGSLKPVLAIIPDEAYDNPTWKGLAYFGRDLVLYGLAIWALVMVSNPLLVIPLVAVAALPGIGLFVVAHDAAHGALFKSKRLNSVIGHIAMLPLWHVYEGWRLGHNRVHHLYTVREGFDFVWHPYTTEQYRDMGVFKRLRHRLEWSWPGAGAYYLREVWWNRMIVGKPRKRWAHEIRRDRLIVLAFVLGSAGALTWLGISWSLSIPGIIWLITRVLVLPFLALIYVIASLVHVHHIQPDIRWWKRADWDKFKGQMDGTTVLQTMPGLDFFFHSIMVHVPHHVDVRIPMYNLELATDAIREAYPGVIHDDKLRFRDFVTNTRQCKLYDFDAQEWRRYSDA